MTNRDLTLCDGKGCKAAKTCRRYILFKTMSGYYYGLEHREGIEKCELYIKLRT